MWNIISIRKEDNANTILIVNWRETNREIERHIQKREEEKTKRKKHIDARCNDTKIWMNEVAVWQQ